MKIGVILTLLVGLSLASPMPDASAARSARIPNGEPVPQAEGAEVAHPEVSRITAEELKQLLDKKGEYVLVDTRDSYSYDYGHIKGAVNIYYDPTGDPLTREMMLIALPMDKLIIPYCDWADDESSASLALELWDLGYDRDMVRVLAEGTLRWEELGYPLTATEK